MGSTSGAPDLVVIEHEPDCPLDRLGEWLTGGTLRIVRPYAGDAVPEAVRDGLIVLGGQMSAYGDTVAPWLPATRRLLRTAVADEVPTLGICLGAQLLAVAAGGEVTVAAPRGRESGVIDVRWRPEAASDPLVRGLPEPTAGPSMHADAVAKLPADSVWLAASEMYPYQAFRVGAAAWGVQFHPEVSLATFRGWAHEHPEVDVDAVTAEFVARDDEIVAAGQALARGFTELVTARARALAPGRR